MPVRPRLVFEHGRRLTWLALLALPFSAGACDRMLGIDDLTFNRDGGVAAGDVECRHHTDCIERYPLDPAICRDSRCLPLKNNRASVDGGEAGDCKVVIGAANLNQGYEPYLFGVLGFIDPFIPESSVSILNYKLALEEISAQTGIPVGGQPRMPVGVVCQARGVSAAALERSIDHLVDDLGVSAVIAGISDAAQLRQSFGHVRAKPHDVFFLSPFSSTNALTSIPDDDLLWHLLPDVIDVAPAYVPLVTRVEDHVNPAPASGPRLPIRLALIVATDYTKLAEIGALLDRELRINGLPAAQNPAEYYQVFNVVSDYTQPDAPLTDEIDRLKAFKPHIVVSAAGPELVKKLLPQLEDDWNEAEQPRPFYVLSPYQIDPIVLLDRLSRERTHRVHQRLAGVNIAAAADSTLYERYLRRLKNAYPDADNVDSTENFYDALYLLAYATAAAPISDPTPSGEPSGRDVARGMRRLLHGMAYEVGFEDLPAALGYLQAVPDNTIALQGTLGPPEFDENGGRKGTGSVWCVEETAAAGFLLRFDVLRYDATAGALSGSFPCFDGL